MRGARAALVFLTRLPGGTLSAADFSRAPAWFGAVGLLLGLAQALVFLAAQQLWPPVIAAMLAVIAGILLTGGLHEDGLADSFDGLGSGRPPARALEIMRDSRIGSHGAIALGLVLALRVATLAALGSVAPWVLIAAPALSRIVMALALRAGPYVRSSGAGTGMTGPLGLPGIGILALSGLVGVLGLTSVSVWAMLAGLVGLLALAGLMRLWAQRRLGGVTGDILGAIQVLGEVGFSLGVLACL